MCGGCPGTVVCCLCIVISFEVVGQFGLPGRSTLPPVPGGYPRYTAATVGSPGKRTAAATSSLGKRLTGKEELQVESVSALQQMVIEFDKF